MKLKLEKPLIDLYILTEFLIPFFFSLCIFLCITVSGFVLFRLIDILVQYGISANLFFRLFIHSLPEMIFYSIPMSVLLASLLSVGRLYKDNEIIIIIMAGKSIFRIFLPIIIFSLILTGASIIFNEFVVSKSNFQFEKDFFYAQTNRDFPISKRHIFYKEFEKNILKRSFYAKEFNLGIMKKPIVEEFENGELKTIIEAEKAEFINAKWIFSNGKIYNFDSDIFTKINFSKYTFSFLSNLENFAKEIRTPREMNFLELKNYIKILKESNKKTSDLDIQLHQKITIPFAILMFSIIGISFGLGKKNKVSSFGFGFSVLFIFIYYTLMFIFTAIGSMGLLNPIFCAWFPNIFILIIGIYAFYRKHICLN